ncbi:MAG: RRXRR domain-containing protein [Deltaproteobacteria bacterium]|nr:RRXRR domain-containing protein [Deltaproteobacteria bacterium]
MKTTLAIDFGSRNIGIALVENSDDRDIPLFAGTFTYDPIQLKRKLNSRPQLRRLRRTRKTKRTRLRRLAHGLRGIGLEETAIDHLVTFCRRRGWKSLFGETSFSDSEKSDSKNEEILFRCSREEFFTALEDIIHQRVPERKRHQALLICESILNRDGNPHREVRKLRIDNRGPSRCAWEGCDRVTPRRENAIKDALAQFVYTIIDREKVAGDRGLQEKLDQTLITLGNLGKRLRNAGGHDPLKNRKEMAEAERKVLRKKIRDELKLVKELSNPESWKENSKNIMNILKESRGRNRYCRIHSSKFVQYMMAGKPIPFKTSLKERDIVSRREEVLFQRIWRYIEARILPLAPNGIDRLVVERVAFDLLAGKRKQRLAVGDSKLEQMYQQGPRYGFKSTMEMLKTEFGGLCVYCGKSSGDLVEREHILPKSNFIFDSYLNLVPSCPACNRQLKARRSPGQAGLKIHPDAFEAYSKYVKGMKPPHHLHTVKKGILKLMTDVNRAWEAEKYLALIAKNYGDITGAQRGPRPLARYLSEKLSEKYHKSPKVDFANGRHTALLREIAYPDFDKHKEKAEGGKINHALDALVLACDLPSPAALEGMNLPVRLMKSWVNKVRKKAPAPNQEGIPRLPVCNQVVDGFEVIHNNNYVEGNLAFFNWNRKNTAIHRQDIYGWNDYSNNPTRRTAAAQLFTDLVSADKEKALEARRKKVEKIVDNIIHPQLKAALMCEIKDGSSD